MSFVERLEKLDREIADAVEAGLAKLRAEIEGRLQAGHEETLRQVRELRADLPGAYVPVAEIADAVPAPEPVAAPEPVDQEAIAARGREEGHAAGHAAGNSEGRAAAQGDVHAAAAAIDRARSQGEILDALLAESPRFASRAAVLLVRPEGLSGWGGQGFDTAKVRQLSVPRHHRLAAGLIEGDGAVALSADDCADFLGGLSADAAREGILIPLVLRDRVTAAVYADALDGRALETGALQTLSHLVALSIETLPFRERAQTATLQRAEKGQAVARAAEPVAAPTVALPIAPPAVAEPEPEPQPETEPEPAATQALSAPQIEPEEEVEATSEKIDLDETAAILGHPQAEDTAVEPEVEAVGVEALGTGALFIEHEPVLPPLDLDSIPLPEPEPSPWTAPSPYLDQPVATEVPTPEPPPLPPADEASGHETVLLRTLPPSVAPATSPFADLPSDLPAEPALPGSPLDAGPTEPLRAVAGGPDAGRTAEVRPPSGVQGPGWAFSTGRMPAVSLDDEPVHEEARRLARLLVSEIKLYNEEQVEEGRRNRDVYERLKEDIDRSRQMYEDRVDPKVVESTDYFYQELVRILAAGDSRALGI